MVDAERAFAERALVVGWKQAFLEFFADSAIGFDGEQVGLAKEQIRANPDPPKDHQLLWEPRYGDVAAQRRARLPHRPVAQHPAVAQQRPAAARRLRLGVEARA